MSEFPEGNAIVYCEGNFRTTNGKTAHGLVRKTRRYKVLSVIDSTCAGENSGMVLDGKPNDIPIVFDLPAALDDARARSLTPTHFVIGLAPDGGRMTREVRSAAIAAIRKGLNVDSGLHDFMSEDAAIASLAATRRLQIRDVRKPPERSKLHAFTGKIEQVTSFKIAMLGTDSAVGKRTTSWVIVDGLNAAGHSAVMIGTGQTAWMQGARYGIILDSLVNDFLAGELEHAVWLAWHEQNPEMIVVEGQGSLMNPAYPGGMEILAATRPDVVILQHAPNRKEYDGFPGYALHSLERQIQAVELLSDKPVVAITVNHEGLSDAEIPEVCARIEREVGRPTVDVLRDGATRLVSTLLEAREKLRSAGRQTVETIKSAT